MHAAFRRWEHDVILSHYEAGSGMVWDVALAFFNESIVLTGMAAQTDGCWEIVLHCCLVEPLGGPGVLIN